MDNTTQVNVSQAIEANIDPEVISNLNNALTNLGISGYENISDLLIGAGNN